jgi:phosphoribosyl 1,2-cyclic phosphodiesterase
MAFSLCILGSGSAGNCTLVTAGRTTLLIDAGFSARETARRWRLSGAPLASPAGILLTHEHGDHVRGAAVVSRQLGAPIYCRASVARAVGLSDATTHGVETLPETPFRVGDLLVTPFPVPHDAEETVGFLFEGEGIRCGYATDMGRVTEDVRAHLRGCHILAIEANHDVDLTREGPYPWSLKRRILSDVGHLSNEAASDLLAEIVGPETIAVRLAHLSETNNSPERALVAARGGLERSANRRAALEAAGQGGPSAWARA